MKKHLLLFTCLLLGISGFSQKKQKTIGIIVAPNGVYDRFREEIDLSYSSGIFYDQFLSLRFGFNTGVQYATEGYEQKLNREIIWDPGVWPERVTWRRHIIEVPINLTYCFNPEASGGYKAFLFSGIMLNRTIAEKTTLYYANQTVIDRRIGYQNDLWADSYMNLGFEVRKNLGADYNIAIGTSAKFRPAHSLDFSSDMRDPIIYNLTLKFGQNL